MDDIFEISIHALVNFLRDETGRLFSEADSIRETNAKNNICRTVEPAIVPRDVNFHSANTLSGNYRCDYLTTRTRRGMRVNYAEARIRRDL